MRGRERGKPNSVYWQISLNTSQGFQDLLEQLEKTAEESEERVSSDALHRVWDMRIHQSFDTQIGILRTGITDIQNALINVPTFPMSPYQVGSAMSATPDVSSSSSSYADEHDIQSAMSLYSQFGQWRGSTVQSCPDCASSSSNWLSSSGLLSGRLPFNRLSRYM